MLFMCLPAVLAVTRETGWGDRGRGLMSTMHVQSMYYDVDGSSQFDQLSNDHIHTIVSNNFS